MLINHVIKKNNKPLFFICSLARSQIDVVVLLVGEAANIYNIIRFDRQ